MSDLRKLKHLHTSLENLPNAHICFLQAGWEACPPNYTYYNFRDLYLIHCVKKGKGTLQINDQTYQLKANDMFLIRPNQFSIYSADGDDPWEYYYFAFNGVFANEIIERTIFKNNQFLKPMPNEMLFDLIQEAAIELTVPNDRDLYGLEYFFKLIRQLTVTNDKTNSNKKIYNDYIIPIQQYIELHYTENIKISEIADLIGLNRTYMYRIFKKYTGLTPEQYLAKFRIQRAKSLISSTDFPLTTISQYVGYENYTPFFLMFKKLEGISPQDYRDKPKA